MENTLSDLLPHLEAAFSRVVTALPAAAAVIVGSFVVYFVIRRGLKLLADKTSLTDSDVAPFARVAKWLITVTAIVVLFGVFGFDLGGMWTMFTTVGALVGVGFIAVWSVLSNWLCTFVILVTRPFAIGDDVEFVGDPVRGRVVDLNFVYTTLRADDGSMLQIPNNLFFQKVLKRRHGNAGVPLAAQLNRSDAAKV